MFKFEIGDLVEYRRTKEPSRKPLLPSTFKRPPLLGSLYDEEGPSPFVGYLGIVIKRYPSQKQGDTAFPHIPFDRMNMYIIYFQQEMSEFLCYEAELDYP